MSSALDHDFGKAGSSKLKTYSYGYSNHQHYQNATDKIWSLTSWAHYRRRREVGGD